MTLEIEYSTANVTDTDAELITCLGQLDNGNRYGLIVTPEEAKFLTGVVTEAMDAGQMLRYEDSVGTKFQRVRISALPTCSIRTCRPTNSAR